MVKPRFLYIALFIVLASTGRFLALVLQDESLSDSEIGLALALGVGSGAASTPYFSRRADERGTLVVLQELVALHLLSSTLLIPLPFVAVEVRFALVLTWRTLSAVFLSPTGSILDAYAISLLGSVKNKTRYGEERLWGAVSWAVTSVLMGLLMDVFSAVPHRSLVISGCCLVVGSLWMIRLIRQSPRTPSAPPGEMVLMGPSLSVFLRTTTDRQMLAFYLIVFALGVGMALVEKLLFLFLVDELQASRFLCGLSVVITVAIEIPLFRYSEKLVACTSYVNLYLIAIVAYCSRVLAYTVMQTSWGVLAVEPLHGVTVACAQTAGVLFMSDRAPRGMEATAQGTFSFLRSLGSLMGTLVGSIILQYLGSAVMYRAASLLVGLCGLVLFAAFRVERRAQVVGVDGVEFEPVGANQTTANSVVQDDDDDNADNEAAVVERA